MMTKRGGHVTPSLYGFINLIYAGTHDVIFQERTYSMMINTTTVTPTENNPLVEAATPLVVAMKTLSISSVTISSLDLTTGRVSVSYTNNPALKVDPSIASHVNKLVLLIITQITQKLTITEDFCGIVITVAVTDKSVSVEYQIIRERTQFTFSGIVLPDAPDDGDDTATEADPIAEADQKSSPVEEDATVEPTP